MRDYVGSILLFMTMVALLTGCSGGSDDAPMGAAPTQAAPGRSADTLPIPGQAGEMPPGHPATGRAGSLAWSIPQGWTEQPPSSNMRIAQYVVDGPDGPGENVGVDTKRTNRFNI